MRQKSNLYEKKNMGSLKVSTHRMDFQKKWEAKELESLKDFIVM